ncbi:MAG: biotin--[acetyl-CoA-carboxylase] ligase, partial [Ruminococcaceae bacterium]|nr:biotin--[acetyl-CoA-carboxylase] ligase [Oscillospiraceae bacterium]
MRHLAGEAKELRLDVRKTVGSTNRIVKDLAAAGAPEGLAVIAEEQTEGRGRLGRSFYSPAGTGIYLSMLLRPELAAEKAVLLTVTAAVAVAEAIEEIADREAQIKWVN